MVQIRRWPFERIFARIQVEVRLFAGMGFKRIVHYL